MSIRHLKFKPYFHISIRKYKTLYIIAPSILIANPSGITQIKNDGCHQAKHEAPDVGATWFYVREIY